MTPKFIVRSKENKQRSIIDFFDDKSRKEFENANNHKEETPSEIGSRTAGGGYKYERYFRDLLNNRLDSDEAKFVLDQLNIDINNVKSLRVEKLGGKLKPDNQIIIEMKSNKIVKINISNKKQDKNGYNHIDRRTVDFYTDKFGFPPILRTALKKYCGVPGFSPVDLLRSGELTKAEYLKLIDIPEKKKHTEEESQGGRFYINELSNLERDIILGYFESHKEPIMRFVLNGDNPDYPVDYVVVGKEKGKNYDHYVYTLEEAFNKACQGKFFLSKPTLGHGSNLRIGPITIQKKGGTGRSTTLQFKWKDIFPKNKG